jgi:small nuclear ribonucleoprotein (snRNP)-like protein
MNLVLGDVVETIYLVDDDDDAEDIKVADASLP